MSDDAIRTIIHQGEWTLALNVRSHWVDWELFESVTGEKERSYWPKGADSAFPAVEDLTKAECEISGFVKWDGCHETRMDQPHGCSPKAARAMLDVVAWAMSEAWRAMYNTPGAKLAFEATTVLPDGKAVTCGKPSPSGMFRHQKVCTLAPGHGGLCGAGTATWKAVFTP